MDGLTLKMEPLFVVRLLRGISHKPEPSSMPAINSALTSLSALHLAAQTPSPEATSSEVTSSTTPPLPSHSEQEHVPKNVQHGEHNVRIGSFKPLGAEQKALLIALLKPDGEVKASQLPSGETQLDFKAVKQGASGEPAHSYSVSERCKPDGQLTELAATCLSDPKQNIEGGFALKLVFDRPFERLPQELKIELFKHTQSQAEHRQGISGALMQTDRSLRKAGETALGDLERERGVSKQLKLPEGEVMDLSLAQRNFSVSKMGIAALQGLTPNQQRFVLDNLPVLTKLGYTIGKDLNELATRSTEQQEYVLREAEGLRAEGFRGPYINKLVAMDDAGRASLRSIRF